MLKNFKINNIKINKKLLLAYSATSYFTFIFFSFFTLLVNPVSKNNIEKYNIYTSKPLEINEYTYNIQTTDARANKIDNIFRDYECPLEGLGEVFVKEADKNNIPWYVVAAISFQESNCGKKIPYIEGEPTYNAWGYGVWGENVHSFKNWVQGIETMSSYLSNRFYSKGVTETNEIMKTYTPPSLGSWYKGVDYFSNLIINYSSI